MIIDRKFKTNRSRKTEKVTVRSVVSYTRVPVTDKPIEILFMDPENNNSLRVDMGWREAERLAQSLLSHAELARRESTEGLP
jgi:hypothetical protein